MPEGGWGERQEVWDLTFTVSVATAEGHNEVGVPCRAVLVLNLGEGRADPLHYSCYSGGSLQFS